MSELVDIAKDTRSIQSNGKRQGPPEVDRGTRCAYAPLGDRPFQKIPATLSRQVGASNWRGPRTMELTEALSDAGKDRSQSVELGARCLRRGNAQVAVVKSSIHQSYQRL